MRFTLSKLDANGWKDIVTADLPPADLDGTFRQLAEIAYGDDVVEVSRYFPGSNFVALRYTERTGQFLLLAGFYITAPSTPSTSSAAPSHPPNPQT